MFLIKSAADLFLSDIFRPECPRLLLASIDFGLFYKLSGIGEGMKHDSLAVTSNVRKVGKHTVKFSTKFLQILSDTKGCCNQNQPNNPLPLPGYPAKWHSSFILCPFAHFR